MATNLPEGYGFIAGRGRVNATKALAAAAAVEVDPILVRTVSGGYVAPLAVVEEYDKTSAAAEPEVDDNAAPPKAGKGSGVDAWADWAERVHGYDKSENLTRDELVERFASDE